MLRISYPRGFVPNDQALDRRLTGVVEKVRC
jgi:hypothetical protein